VGLLRLGLYPFAAALKHYEERRFGLVGESTLKEELKTLLHLGKVFEELKAEADNKDGSRPFTTDPRIMGRLEIQTFMAWMKKPSPKRRKGLDPVTQVLYLKGLKNFLRTFENHIIEDMAADGVRFPKAPKKPIRTVGLEDLQTIFRAADQTPGWHGTVARGMMVLFFATGVRPSELRLARQKDINMNKQTLSIRHPNGEGSWALEAKVNMIRPDMVPIIVRFLRERQQHVEDAGLGEVLALFPNLTRGKDGFYSANAFKSIKKEIEVASGVEFKLKDFRPTLTSITVNGDMSFLPTMSAQLRHTNLATTQRSYYAMQQGVAGRQLKKSFNISGSITAQDPVIEKNGTYLGMNESGPGGIRTPVRGFPWTEAVPRRPQ
jgi:integrase